MDWKLWEHISGIQVEFKDKLYNLIDRSNHRIQMSSTLEAHSL